MRTMRGIVRLTVAATVLAMFVANGGIPAGHPVLAPIRLVDREAPLQPFTVPGILAVDPPDYRRAVDQYMAIFGDADHLKFTKTLPYVIYVMSAKDPADTDLDHPWEMTTGCLDTDQVRGRKPPASVVMKVYPGGLTARSDEWNIMVAHEAFHAMSCAMSKAATDFYQLTPWVQEGMAEWAAKDVTGNADYEKFSEYVGTPARSLLQGL